MKHNLLAIAYFRTIPGNARSIHLFQGSDEQWGLCWICLILQIKTRSLGDASSAGELELRGWEATPRHHTRTWFEPWPEFGSDSEFSSRAWWDCWLLNSYCFDRLIQYTLQNQLPPYLLFTWKAYGATIKLFQNSFTTSIPPMATRIEMFLSLYLSWYSLLIEIS